MLAQLVAAAVKIVAVSCQHWQQSWPHNQLTTLPKRIANRNMVCFFREKCGKIETKVQTMREGLWGSGRFTFKQGASDCSVSFSTRCVYVLSASSRLAPPRVSFAMRRDATGCLRLLPIGASMLRFMLHIACCCVVHVKIEKSSVVLQCCQRCKICNKTLKTKKIHVGAACLRFILKSLSIKC